MRRDSEVEKDAIERRRPAEARQLARDERGQLRKARAQQRRRSRRYVACKARAALGDSVGVAVGRNEVAAVRRDHIEDRGRVARAAECRVEVRPARVRADEPRDRLVAQDGHVVRVTLDVVARRSERMTRASSYRRGDVVRCSRGRRQRGEHAVQPSVHRWRGERARLFPRRFDEPNLPRHNSSVAGGVEPEATLHRCARVAQARAALGPARSVTTSRHGAFRHACRRARRRAR